MRNLVPVLVILLAVVLAAAAGVSLLTDSTPQGYAALVPPPDSIEWEVDAEDRLWLEAGRRDVELQISSVGLGLAGFYRQTPDDTVQLGDSAGCRDWAVTSFSVEGRGLHGGLALAGEVDRGTTTAELIVRIRYRHAVTTDWSTSLAGVQPNAKSFSICCLPGNVPWFVEASASVDFPPGATRAVHIAGNLDSATDDSGALVVPIPRGVGVGLVGCGETSGIGLGLYAGDTELREYTVDVAAAGSGPVRSP